MEHATILSQEDCVKDIVEILVGKQNGKTLGDCRQGKPETIKMSKGKILKI